MRQFDAPSLRREIESPVPEHPLDYLLTERRRRRFRQVLARRVKRLTVVVDNCYDPHNASAVVRTCDAFGVHTLNVITDRNSFKPNRKITQGAHLYTESRVFQEVAPLYHDLHERGFRILVADLAADAVVDPHDLGKMHGQTPLALVFGNEEGGASEEAIAQADGRFLIPMSGFTQSLNLSVSVAITLFSLRHEALASDLPGDMDADEQQRWYDRWVRRHAGRRAGGEGLDQG